MWPAVPVRQRQRLVVEDHPDDILLIGHELRVRLLNGWWILDDPQIADRPGHEQLQDQRQHRREAQQPPDPPFASNHQHRKRHAGEQRQCDQRPLDRSEKLDQLQAVRVHRKLRKGAVDRQGGRECGKRNQEQRQQHRQGTTQPATQLTNAG